MTLMRAKIRLVTLDPDPDPCVTRQSYFSCVMIIGSLGTEAATPSGEDGEEEEEEVTLEASREGYYPNLDPLRPGQHR